MTPPAVSWDAVGRPGTPGLVLVHSLGTDRTMWARLRDAARDDHRVVLVELPGHGRSKPPDGPCSLEELSRAVLHAADEAKLHRFHYCGVSLGGMIGLWIAANRPERAQSLVAANTAARIGTAAFWEERIRLIETDGLEALRDAVMARWLSPRFVTEQPDRVAELGRIFCRTSVAGYTACCAALASADLGPDLARIGAPTLVVAGRLDQATPVAASEELHARIRGSRLAVLEGASHLSNVDAPDAFCGLVTDFLRGIAAGTPHDPGAP
jgi:3-oxoadipate enol-lactonase